MKRLQRRTPYSSTKNVFNTVRQGFTLKQATRTIRDLSSSNDNSFEFSFCFLFIFHLGMVNKSILTQFPRL